MSFRQILGPFSSRNYQLYFSGQLVSLLGTWMTQTATVWLVYDLTKSPFWLGLVTLLGQAPAVLLSPIGGVWVDRLDRLNLLKFTQMLAMAQSLALAVFTFTGHIDIWILTALAMFQGLINAVDLPTRQSLNFALAEKREHLSAIIGMNSSMFNLARLIGPAVAGFIIAGAGAGWCFLIDGLSYAAVIAALFTMRLQTPKPSARTATVWREMTDGLGYAWRVLPIRALILFTGAMGIFGMSFSVLVPVFAAQTFSGDARTLGYLMSSSAVGSMLAALYLAGRSSLRGLGHAITIGGLLTGAGLMVFAFSSMLWLSMLCLVCVGAGAILVFASNNTLVQNLVEEDKRGRVMSIYTISFMGGMPIGGLVTGALADWIGISATASLNAISCLVLTVLFFLWLPRLRKEARPILERAGLIPRDQSPSS